MTNRKVKLSRTGAELNPRIFTHHLNNTASLNSDEIAMTLQSIKPAPAAAALIRITITPDGGVFPQERYNSNNIRKCSIILASKYVANLIEWHLKHHVPERRKRGESQYGTSIKSLTTPIGDLYLKKYLQATAMSVEIERLQLANKGGIVEESIVATDSYWHALYLMPK